MTSSPHLLCLFHGWHPILEELRAFALPFLKSITKLRKDNHE
jgi:hypothetical protein